MYHGPAFVACIMNLYGKLKYKIKYIRGSDGKPTYKELYELDDYLFQKKDLGKMTFAEANKYFDLMRAFIEDIGITRFEIDKLTLKERIHRAAVE
jgi:hypothetical protein